MRTPAQADVQRWSDEVARDPRSLAFLPLARAYRRQGLHDTALRLTLRGLEAYPSHVEAHGLLALLYVEQGDHEKAADEWSIVLRIDPDNFEALRGMGFCYLQQDRLSRARQMLERAALLRPNDPAVSEALRMLGARGEATEPAAAQEPAGTAGSPAEDEPWAAVHDGPRWDDELPFTLIEDEPAGRKPDARSAGADEEAAPDDPALAESIEARRRERLAAAAAAAGAAGAANVSTSATPPAPAAAAPAPPERPRDARPVAPQPTADSTFGYSPMADPASLFEDLVGSGPVLGAVVVDAHGLVLAGRMVDADRDAAVLGAVLGGAAFEAARTAAHLSLGEWRGITMEAADALLHIVPAGTGALVVLAARRGTPAGWMRRAAAQAADRAQLYLEAYG